MDMADKATGEDELLRRITVDPAIFGGKPIIRGMRMAVEHVLGMLAAGDTPERLLWEYSFLEPADIQACLAYAHMVAVRRAGAGTPRGGGRSVKFLLDVCVSSHALQTSLTTLGHDVVSAYAIDPKASDERLMAVGASGGSRSGHRGQGLWRAHFRPQTAARPNRAIGRIVDRRASSRHGRTARTPHAGFEWLDYSYRHARAVYEFAASGRG